MSERPDGIGARDTEGVPEQPDQRTETPSERGEELGVGRHDDETVAGALESVVPGSEEDLAEDEGRPPA